MRLVIGMGALAAALTAAATITWVDVLDDQRARAAAPAPPSYVPPTVEIDQGVHLTYREVATEVARLVNDPRGWRADLGQFTLRIVKPGIGGTTPMSGTAHIGMAHDATDTVLVTDEAWTTLGPRFAAAGGSLEDQRTWIVLHELGHMLGHPHTDCTGAGPAPVMRGTNWMLGGCSYNVWPNP